MYGAMRPMSKRALARKGAHIDGRTSLYSIRSLLGTLSIGSAGSILSIGSVGLIWSIGSAGGIRCIGSAGSILSVGRKEGDADEP